MSDNTATKRVVITGIGGITPIGHTATATWEAAAAGVSGTGTITQFDTTGFDYCLGAEIKNFDPGAHFGAKEVRRIDRVSQLALIAAREAMDDSKLVIDDSNCWDIGVIIGCAVGGINTLTSEYKLMLQKGPRRLSPFTMPMMLPDTATGQLAIHFKARGPNMCIATACASSNHAIGEAFEMVRGGRMPAVITGGCEAAINDFALTAFHNMGALCTLNDTPATASRPFDATRNGFVTGEGAAILIMESLDHAQARGARIYAEVVGYGATDDAHHITAPDVNGPTMAMRAALRRAGLEPKDIDYVNAHGTSTPLNDSNETKAIKTVFGDLAHSLTISSTKSMTGHCLGAAGAIESLFCIGAINHGVIPPTINLHTPDPDCDLNYTPNTAVQKTVRHALSNSFGFGGHNGCLVFSKFEA